MSLNLLSLAESPRRAVWMICLVGLALVGWTAFLGWLHIDALLIRADNDDQMRLMEVRDLIAGQSWWDTRQHRILPPEGISMHWSRYIDAGIAGIALASSRLVEMATAESIALVLWPSVLAGLMVLIIAHGTSRLLGAASAIGALAVFLTWSKMSAEFSPPRIDHHNVQILCATALFYLAIVPGRAWLLGLLGGLVTAFGLAIGLEQLPLYATIWGLMALRHAFGQANAGPWLLGFGAAFTTSAPLFMIGQRPMSDWLTPWCDVLATPVLAFGLVGAVATVVTVLAGRLLTRPLPRIAVLLVLSGLGLWLAYPVLGQCLAGPYSAVSPEVRNIIDNHVLEALPATKLIETNPGLLGRILLPPMITAGFAALVLWALRGRLSGPQRTALMQAFVVIAMGLCFALVQIRAAHLMTPAVPFLAGFVIHGFTRLPRESWMRVPYMLALLGSLPVVVETLVDLPKKALVASTPSLDSTKPKRNCRTHSALAEINRLPPSLILSTANIGPAILVYTPHRIASAFYHRSVEAVWNGFGAFLSKEALRAAAVKTGADYVVLCVGSQWELENPATAALQAGQLPDWLIDVSGDAKEVRLLQIDKSRLAEEP